MSCACRSSTEVPSLDPSLEAALQLSAGPTAVLKGLKRADVECLKGRVSCSIYLDFCGV